ncbi:MAG: autotransporter outer membrane beta-barrel domain-containing protein [Akkermansia sp.]
MKTHLPPTLRSALLACMTVFSPLSITLTSATLVTAVAMNPALAADSAYYAGGSLEWADGCDGFTTSAGEALEFKNGFQAIFTEGVTEATLAGNVVTESITLNGTVSLSLTGGKFSLNAGEIILNDTSSLTFKDNLLSSNSYIGATSSINAKIIFDASDAETVFNDGAKLKDYQGNIIVQSGHLNLVNEAGFTFNDVSLTSSNAVISFGSNTTMDRILIPDNVDTVNAKINLADGVQMKVSGGANSTHSGSYRRGATSSSGSRSGYTITLGQGALLSDNVNIWQGRDPINIMGKGRYEVSSLLVGYTGIQAEIVVNVGAGATFAIIGASNKDGLTNSLVLGGASNVTPTVNIDGTFIINSQIARYTSAKSVINVNDGGLFVLNAGFMAYNRPGTADNLSINVKSGGSLQVGNQIPTADGDVDYSSAMSVTMATNTSLASNGVADNTFIHHSIQYAQGGTHTLKASAGDTLTMLSAVNNAGTLNITGGGSVQLAYADGNKINNINVAGNTTLLLKDGINLFAQGGSLNLNTGSRLDMSAGATRINGQVNLSNKSHLVYQQGLAGAAMGAGNKLTLDGAGFTLGFDSKVVGAFEQTLFTGLSAEQLAGFGLIEGYYNGMLACDASDILADDNSWFLAEGSVIYLDGAGNLILNNLAVEAYWNETGDGAWNATNNNWLADGKSDDYLVSRQLIFSNDASLNKNITVEGTVSTFTMDVLGDYSFSGGSIVVEYALNIGDGAQVAIDSTLNLNDASLNIGDDASLTLKGGNLKLNDAASSIGNQSNLTLHGGNLSLKGASLSMGNETNLTLKDTNLSILVQGDQFFNAASNPLIQMGDNSSLNMSGGQLSIEADGALDISRFNGTILVLTDEGKLNMDGVTLDFAGGAFDKYFSTIYMENGTIKGELNRTAYNGLAQTANGLVGLKMMSNALIEINPQWKDAENDSALAKVLDELDIYKTKGQSAAADALGAAIAGASTSVLGPALMGDVKRQLGSIRNRSKFMGVDPSQVHDSMPYVNAWISAEGGSTRLSSDGTMAGYSLNSVGASIGVDFDLTEKFSIGFAYSALRGDLSADSTDSSTGDMDTMYGSVYARLNHKRWSHSFVASFGTADVMLNRSIATSGGIVNAKGDTSGSAMGLMYEVGYTYALNEDASSCIQPLFNISYVKSQIDGYSEKDSDIALQVSNQSLNSISIGAGALYETIIGEDVYNRSSVLSARAMLKYDAGDRSSETDVILIALNGASETVKGAEYGAMGVELGVGLSIPITDDSGLLFIDASCDLRSGQNSFSGTVGYRFTF